MFFKIGALKDFVIFWIKKRLQQRCFCKYCFFFFFFFDNSAFIKHIWWLLLHFLKEMKQLFCKGIPEKWDPGPETQDQGPESHTWDPGPATLHLRPFRNPGPLRGSRVPGHSTWDHSPWTWDPTCGNRNPLPLCGRQDPYLVTLTLIQLFLNLQFSSVA